MAKISRIHIAGCDQKNCACRWRLDYRPLGLRGPRRRLEFGTKTAAARFLSSTSEKAARGEYIAPAAIPVFSDLAASWLTGKVNHHPASIAGWRTHLGHLAPLDATRVDRIDVSMVEKLRDQLLEKLSATTVRKILTTLGAVLKLAQRRKVVSSNAAALAERPRQRVAEVTTDDDDRESGHRPVRPDEILSDAEISKLLDASTPGLFRTLFALTAATGLRPEEIYGLKWANVELGDGGKLYVRLSLSWSRGAGEIGRVRPKFFPPKTASGTRAIPLPVELLPMLKAWKLQCPRSEYDLVFCRDDGAPLHRSNVLRQGLYPALRRAGLRRANLKTLRHSYASGLIAQGAPVTEVAALMGHSSPAVTLKVYSHWFKGGDSGAATRFTARFLKASSAHMVPTSISTGVTERDR